MPGSLRTFSWNSRVRAVAALLGIGLLAVCVYSALNVTREATAARPTPHVGERLSVFTSTYGQPDKLGTDKGLKVGHITVEGVRFYADAAQTIIINAQPTQGIVNNLTVTGPATWTSQQSFAYCERFLPTGAAAYRSVGQYTYFHSNVGDVVINNAEGGTCEVLVLTSER